MSTVSAKIDNAGILEVLRATDVANALARQGADPEGSTPERFEGYLKSEIAKWAMVIRNAGIRAD